MNAFTSRRVDLAESPVIFVLLHYEGNERTIVSLIRLAVNEDTTVTLWFIALAYPSTSRPSWIRFAHTDARKV